MDTKESARPSTQEADTLLALWMAPSVAPDLLTGIPHRCSACGARGCVATAEQVAAGRYTSADLMRWYVLGTQHERERAAGAEHEHGSFWDRSAEQIYADAKAERMRQMAEAAKRFHERELGRPYVEFKGASG